MKYFIMLVVLASTLTVSNVEAAQKQKRVENFSLHQKHILTTAYNLAKEDGLKNPYILSGILLVESNAGKGKKFRTSKHKPLYDKSVGIAQILPSTAKMILKRYPNLRNKMNNKGLNSNLANNDSFNISLASKYLVELSKKNHSDAQLIAAYNLGHSIKKPEKMFYVKKVQSQIRNIQNEFNQ